MELLARLLGGYDRVKIMRFFLHHVDGIFDSKTVTEKLKLKATSARKELQALATVGFVEKKKTRMMTFVRSGKKESGRVKEVVGWKLNSEFPHNAALRDLLFDFEGIDKRELASRFRQVGRIKLFVVAGVFVGEEKARVDILLVGEAIKRNLAERAFDTLTAELGRDVIFSIMDVEEYEYRKKMYDKFIRDIFDLPHEIVIDKLSKTIQ